MSRLGLSSQELAAVVEDQRRLDGIELRYVMSHLACAEQQDYSLNAQQLTLFQEARHVLPRAGASLANSSGVFLGPDYHFDLARPGAALYGVAPVAGAPNPMKQVVRLQGKVIQVRAIEAGTGVGYGVTWRAPSPRRIATVSVGYADGFLRSLSNRAVAWFDDTPLPLVGIISMDTITLDVSDLPADALQPDSLIDLINEWHTVDALAQEAGTIGYEILTSLGGRYFRQYVGG
jgi:alanine racemase